MLVTASLSLLAPAAHAEAPTNDPWESATPVTAFPFEDTVDTTEATTDPVNPPEMNRYTGHSVWYHIQPPKDGRVLFLAHGTDHDHGLGVYEAPEGSTPDQWTRLTWHRGVPGDGAGVVAELESGKDYYAAISTWEVKPGGTAQLQVRRPAQVRYSLDREGRFDPVDGSAILRGTISSTLPVEVGVQVTLRQLVRRWVVLATDQKVLRPTTETTPWHFRIGSRHGFSVGKARITRSRVWVFDAEVKVATYSFRKDTVRLR